MLKIAGILGIVEGLTEFLPVSSTGHLILAGHLLNFTGERAATFEIFIQLGAILAVVALYWEKFASFLTFKKEEGFSGINGLKLLIVTTLPAVVLGAGLHHFIKEHLFTPVTVAAGLMAGSVWILAVEMKCKAPKKESLDLITWKDALIIGFCQALAMWPGMSRAAATILGGMMLGYSRKTATQFSFFAAVPVMIAATVLDLVKSLHILHGADFKLFGLGFVISFIVAWMAIKFFINYVSKHTLTAFAIYRIALAVGVLLILK